jgi:hypothetical protein
MPSRKHRRRREKERRHEYEVVYVDQAGRELDAADVQAETQAAREARKRDKPSAQAQRTPQQRVKGGTAGELRPVSPPSWRRVLRRGAIFAPFMFLTLWLLGKGHLTGTAIVLETIWLLALFVPFSYGIDRMMYRRYIKAGGSPPARQPRA